MNYTEVFDANYKEYGAAVLFQGSDKKLIKGNYPLGLELNVLCDWDVPANEISELTWFKSFHGVENITMKSSSGCPAFTTNRLFIIMNAVRYAIAPIFIVAGGFLVFKGRDKIHISTAITTFVALAFSLLFLAYHLMFFGNRMTYFDCIVVTPIVVGSSFGAYAISQRKLRLAVYLQSTTAFTILGLMLCTMI